MVRACARLRPANIDDFEPSYLPNGDIVFVSSRCKRWVNCWLTQVAVLHRCGPNGENLHAISSNNEQDNTPWPLPDGRLLYTRWEYVDRSQVDYHHLWVANPDGTAQMNWYGNLHPGIVMIDAKPIPGSDKVVASFSPGHGQREHAGRRHAWWTPRPGPTRRPSRSASPRATNSATRGRSASTRSWRRLGPALVFLDDQGRTQEIYRLPRRTSRRGWN